MHYRVPKELLFENGTNSLANVIEHYLRKLHTRYRYTILHHPWTNEKVKNFYNILGDILTKSLEGKPTKLSDEYLSQILFATKRKAHNTSKYSIYYLLYDYYPYISSDDNHLWLFEIDTTISLDHEKTIANFQNAWLITNEVLLERAIKAKKIQKEKINKKR